MIYGAFWAVVFLFLSTDNRFSEHGGERGCTENFCQRITRGGGARGWARSGTVEAGCINIFIMAQHSMRAGITAVFITDKSAGI